MSIPDQFPRLIFRAVPAEAVPPESTAEAGVAGVPGVAARLALAAVSAAVWFDFFLTVPYERFTITRRADIETTALILAVEQRLVAAGLADRAAAALAGIRLAGLQ
jgi:hypothetical protein